MAANKITTKPLVEATEKTNLIAEHNGVVVRVAGFGELKSDIESLGTNYVIKASTNKCDTASMVVGIIDRTTGLVDTSDTALLTTDYIKIDQTQPKVVVTMQNRGNDGRLCQANRMAFYDANKNLLYCYASTNAPVDVYPNAVYVRASVDVRASKFMVVFNNGEYSTSMADFEPFVAEGYDPVPYIPSNMLARSTNLFDGKTFIGRIGRDGELDTAQANFVSTDYISISGLSGYVVPEVRYGKILRNSIAYYNTERTYIGGSYGTYEEASPVPEGAAFVRVSWQNIYSGFFVGVNEDGTLMPYEPHYIRAVSGKVPSMANKYHGKFISCIGDSITAQGQWQHVVADALGCGLINCGVSGSLISGNADDAFWKDARINTTDKMSDAVYIMGATNDGLNHAEIGAVSRSNTDTDTVVGAFNVMLSKLLYKHMHIKYYTDVDYTGVEQIETPNSMFEIVIGTPIYCADSRSTMDEYADVIRKVAALWAVKCVDCHNLSGINAATSVVYLSDGVHPNELGGVKLGTCICEGLL